MKKVAFFINYIDIYGGIERVTAALSSELLDYAEIYIVSCLKSSADIVLDWYPKKAKVISLNMDSLSVHKHFFEVRNNLCEVINKYEFDIVIMQFWDTGFYAKDIKRKTNAEVIVCDHGTIFCPGLLFQKKIKLKRIASGCDKLIVLTERCKNAYIDQIHVPENKLLVIPNWIDNEVNHGTGYDIESKRIITVGRLCYQKGFEVLIDAFKQVHKRFPDWTLDIIGDGEEEEKLKYLIKDYGLEGHVFLKGKIPDMRENYNGYSFYVMSSRYEGLPMVLLEAKQNYLPIVSFDIDAGPSDVITDGVNGLLVRPGDTNGLADAMCKMIENPEMRLSMSENTQMDIDRFSKETITRQWLEVLGL